MIRFSKPEKDWETEMTYALCFFIGFLAELIDGSLGMAYGVSCSTFLRLCFGMPPLEASSLVHISEIFTSGVSAFSHFRLKNIDKALFWRLLIPGVIGGVLGALLLSRFGARLEKAVSVYLIVMGGVLLVKAIRNKPPVRKGADGAFVYPVAALGGMLDAAGGGGWGPVVTSTLLSRSEDASRTIGSVNAAEFFVTAAEVVAFSFAVSGVGEHLARVVLLILGGVAAAPLAVLLCKKLNRRVLLFAVGLLVAGLNVYKLFF